MKKFMKVCAITALVMLAVGFILALLVQAVKGNEYMNHFLMEVTDNKIVTWLGSAEEWADQADSRLHHFEGYDIDDASIFDKEHAVEKGDVEHLFSDLNVDTLKVDLGGCVLEIYESEEQAIRVTATNTGKFQAFQEGSEICIRSTRKTMEDIEKCVVTLYLPRDFSWKKVELEIGAGKITVKNLNTAEMELEAGAGQILVENVAADKLEASVGAGQIRLEQMQVTNLDVTVGMGEFTGNGTVLGNVEAECSMGNLELTLNGSPKDFNYDLECSMGNITLNQNEHYTGLAQEKRIDHGAGKKMDLECAMGNIQVSFRE